MRVIVRVEKSAKKTRTLICLIKPVYRNRIRLGKAAYSVTYLMADYFRKNEKL
mgnify:FL=1